MSVKAFSHDCQTWWEACIFNNWFFFVLLHCSLHLAWVICQWYVINHDRVCCHNQKQDGVMKPHMKRSWLLSSNSTFWMVYSSYPTAQYFWFIYLREALIFTVYIYIWLVSHPVCFLASWPVLGDPPIHHESWSGQNSYWKWLSENESYL